MASWLQANIDVNIIRKRLREIVGEIDKLLSFREKERDAMIKKSRDVIRLSGWIINAIHRGSLEEAKQYLNELEKAVKEFLAHAKSDNYLFYSGLVDSTLAEYVEAVILYKLVTGEGLPGPNELGVTEISYLQGLGDVVGELRRLALDFMRVDRLEEAELMLELMEVIYNELRGLEYPDALIPGVKRKVDVARRLIDDTKALLIEVKGRKEVLKALAARPN
ncbi:MAG TPA: haloacid dehalogenase [Pyrodictium sp.]|nr:haloacid dehalogenase [Pyrodictium sp.]